MNFTYENKYKLYPMMEISAFVDELNKEGANGWVPSHMKFFPDHRSLVYFTRSINKSKRG